MFLVGHPLCGCLRTKASFVPWLSSVVGPCTSLPFSRREGQENGRATCGRFVWTRLGSATWNMLTFHGLECSHVDTISGEGGKLKIW